MIDVSYENLYRAIYPSLPVNWQRVVIRAAFGDGSSSIKYYVQQDGKYCDCFDLVSDQSAILEIIANVHYTIATTRDNLAIKNRWNAITVVIEADGTFRSDFDYDEKDWVSNETLNEWEGKYLNI